MTLGNFWLSSIVVFAPLVTFVVFMFVEHGTQSPSLLYVVFPLINVFIGFIHALGAPLPPWYRLAYCGLLIIMSMPVAFALMYSSVSIQTDCIEGAHSRSDFLYFSYVAFTTVGFGDLQPVGICRVIAAFEAIVGYLSLGLFVGAVIGFFSTKSTFE